MRVFLTVLDSVGIGAAPDADDYGDTGAATLPNLAAAVDGLHLPFFSQLGLGNIPPLLPGGTSIQGIPANPHATASWGALRAVSHGKDTTTGHWELAGLRLDEGFAVFPPGPPAFPAALTDAFTHHTGHGILGNCAASGTAIIDQLGDEHLATGDWIVYTSADSVFQIAAHEDRIPLDDLYAACRIARKLCNPYRVGRVIARPFTGSPGRFSRTRNRRDFSSPMPEPCLLDVLGQAGVRTVTIGKLDDIFPGAHIDEAYHLANNFDALERLASLIDTAPPPCFVFTNLIDFDMRYGHRRDTAGYASALEDTDRAFATLFERLGPEDAFIITADHGNDPTFHGSDHTREWVPLLLYRPNHPGQSLGCRNGFYDIAQSVATAFGAPAMPRGHSFWTEP